MKNIETKPALITVNAGDEFTFNGYRCKAYAAPRVSTNNCDGTLRSAISINAGRANAQMPSGFECADILEIVDFNEVAEFALTLISEALIASPRVDVSDVKVDNGNLSFIAHEMTQHACSVVIGFDGSVVDECDGSVGRFDNVNQYIAALLPSIVDRDTPFTDAEFDALDRNDDGRIINDFELIWCFSTADQRARMHGDDQSRGAEVDEELGFLSAEFA